MSPRRSFVASLAVLTIAANVGLAWPTTRYASAFALLWILPGLAAAGAIGWLRSRLDFEAAAIGAGLGIGAVALLALLVHYVPGPVEVWPLLVAVNVMILVLCLVTLAQDRREPSPTSLRDSAASAGGSVLPSLLAVVTVASGFRLLQLGYSEFQGDEGIVMMRAARAIMGDDAQFFYHQKGPIEILLPLATWTLSESINEWQARLPFAVAGILSIAAIYLLGRRWFSNRAGIMAALLLGINGFYIGFGRIVQYQGLVLAASVLGLLALWKWSEGEGRRWLLAGAGLLAIGLLAHYDAALALPAAAYIVGRRLRQLWAVRSERRSAAVGLVIAAGLALSILALFYVPYACHPSFAKTLRYLTGARIGSGGPLYSNLISSLPLATFYNSAYYLIGLTGLLVIASLRGFRGAAKVIPILGCILLALLSLGSGSASPSWIGPLSAVLLAAIVLAPRSSAPERAAWLWFGAPFIFYYFLVWDPRTHVLNVFPAAVLLGASALDYLLDLVPLSYLRSIAAALVAVFLFLGYHSFLMFVQHSPEIKRTWPTNQPAAYWRPDDDVPRFGFFGFPYRVGWKAVGDLMARGVIDGAYASNEEQEVTALYARGEDRTFCRGPEWYVLADNVQDEVAIDEGEIEAAYHLWGEVQVAGTTKLRVFRRGHAGAPPTTYHAEDSVARFDAGTTPAASLRRPAADLTPAGYVLGDKARLVGYRLEPVEAEPGEEIHLTLYWEALAPMRTVYQVFVHLYDGTMWGQQDGTPGCGLMPTVLWDPGQIVRDDYVVSVHSSTPPGDIPLLVGMYSLETGERLPVMGPDGELMGDAIPLTTVAVR